MKRILMGIFTLLWLSFSLAGCMADVDDVTVAVKNASTFELKWVVFDMPPSSW